MLMIYRETTAIKYQQTYWILGNRERKPSIFLYHKFPRWHYHVRGDNIKAKSYLLVITFYKNFMQEYESLPTEVNNYQRKTVDIHHPPFTVILQTCG